MIQLVNKGHDKAKAFITTAIEEGKTSLLEYEAEQVAKQYGIKVATSRLAQTEKQAVLLAKGLSYPIVMKIVSEDILHKSNSGGVKTDINSAQEVRAAYKEILRNAKRANRKANIKGILVQKMATKGQEFVVGAVRDPQFGPTIMFGLGGIYVELFKDVSFRIAPVDERNALAMMKDIKAAPLLSGFRGSNPLDVKAAAKTIMQVSDLMMDQEQIESADINPLFIYPRGVMAVDVRIILRKPESQKSSNHLKTE